MLSAAEKAEAAAALARAATTGEPIPPLTERWPDLDVADAYAIQEAVIGARLEAGARRVGWKVGLTSVAMQRQLGVDQPDFGPLLDDMEIAAGGTCPLADLIAPRVEGEIAFWLARDLEGEDLGEDDVLAACDRVVPALEIIDSRIADWKITLPDTIADNASSGGVVLGSRPVRPSELDLSLTGCLLRRNGRIEGTGAGGAVLGSPVNALVWLANTLGPLGAGLEPGQVVLPGSLTAAIPFGPGDTVSATFDRIGSVSVTFSEK
jgi:2-keto-4-pentenoate hydratase